MSEDKGEWAEVADEGIVDHPENTDDDRELGSEVTGAQTGDDRPATETGIDLSAGDQADAVTDGGPDSPDQRDAATGARKPDRDSAA